MRPLDERRQRESAELWATAYWDFAEDESRRCGCCDMVERDGERRRN